MFPGQEMFETAEAEFISNNLALKLSSGSRWN